LQNCVFATHRNGVNSYWDGICDDKFCFACKLPNNKVSIQNPVLKKNSDLELVCKA
jgi:hypothetical protein